MNGPGNSAKLISTQDFLQGLSADDFAAEAAEYIGDLNRLHPFREGNGRTQLQTQLQYLKQLGAQAGHPIDLTRFEQKSWIQASIESGRFETALMRECIRQAIKATGTQ